MLAIERRAAARSQADAATDELAAAPRLVVAEDVPVTAAEELVGADVAEVRRLIREATVEQCRPRAGSRPGAARLTAAGGDRAPDGRAAASA
jgi:hypothetical protein